MNHDNEKDAQRSTTPRYNATSQAAESSSIKRELNDDEIASVSAGGSPVFFGPNPPVYDPHRPSQA